MGRSKRSLPLERELGTLCRRVLLDLLARVNGEQARLHVPRLQDHVMEHPGLHFHFHPDLIIGLRGRTKYEFIHESFIVGEGDLAVIPGGIPHREVPPLDGDHFENIIVSVYNETVSVQLQVGTAKGVRTATEYFDTAKYQKLAHYLEEAAEIHHDLNPPPRLGTKGLLLIYLSTLESVISRVQHAPRVEKLKISQTKRLVQEHMGQGNLSVKYLAGLLHCSSDYLSHLFHRETGLRLAMYINRERVRAAMTMLSSTPLTVAEVAYAVGFESQGYFSRVFKQIALKNPMAYRRSVEHSVVELEGRPRTIYAAASV